MMLKREDIQKVLSEQVDPRLAMDSGGIDLVDVTKENVVKVRLRGACSGCPGARMTLQMGVERVLRDAFPEIKSVESV